MILVTAESQAERLVDNILTKRFKIFAKCPMKYSCSYIRISYACFTVLKINDRWKWLLSKQSIDGVHRLTFKHNCDTNNKRQSSINDAFIRLVFLCICVLFVSDQWFDSLRHGISLGLQLGAKKWKCYFLLSKLWRTETPGTFICNWQSF